MGDEEQRLTEGAAGGRGKAGSPAGAAERGAGNDPADAPAAAAAAAASSPTEVGHAAVTVFKKRAGPSKNLRKRREASPATGAPGAAEAAEDGARDGAVVRTKIRRDNAHNPLVQGARSKRARRATGTSDAADDDGDAESAARPPSFAYKAAKRLVAQQSDGGATRYAEWDPETDREAKALLDRHHADVAAEDDGLYRGLSEYKSFVAKPPVCARVVLPRSHSLRQHRAGPIRAPANVRAISVIDYQVSLRASRIGLSLRAPDICKDYKETGYCGYGDSCKFMHDRGDYKSGWQLEKEWREKGHIGKRGKNEYELEGSDSDSDDDLPFACLICREEFKRPVKTNQLSISVVVVKFRYCIYGVCWANSCARPLSAGVHTTFASRALSPTTPRPISALRAKRPRAGCS
ncbi:MAG: hypothetical protein BJ554DRAFT_5938, partial [Olpidium bornovanus]